MKIVASIAIISGHEGLKMWFLLQCKKGSTTLRYTPKGDKPSPIIVHREGQQDGQISNFLAWEETCKDVENYFARAYNEKNKKGVKR